jgi:hypothetical protein
MGFLGELRCERFNSTGKPYRFMPPFLAQVLSCDLRVLFLPCISLTNNLTLIKKIMGDDCRVNTGYPSLIVAITRPAVLKTALVLNSRVAHLSQIDPILEHFTDCEGAYHMIQDGAHILNLSFG